MNKIITSAVEALKNDEVQEALRTLAKFNLGVCVPHMHESATGEIIPLPPNMVSCEQDLTVSFVRSDEVSEEMLPVGWRWNGTNVEVCLNCCVTTGPK